MTESPRVYVASLMDYNNGILHGAWIDAAQDEDDFATDVAAMLSKSPTAASEGSTAEEWAIHDYEGFGGLKLSEHESLESVSTHARMIAEHGPAWAAYANMVGAEHATEDGFEDAYCGEYESEEDFAYQLADDIGLFDIRDSFDHKVDVSTLETYFDWDKWTRDLFMGDYSSAESPSGGVYVFRSY